MYGGYLVIETNASHPDLIRLYEASRLPRHMDAQTGSSHSVPRHAVYFDDLAAARMHAQNLLRSASVDVESGLYRISTLNAICVVESIGLRHRRAFSEPALSEDPSLAICIERLRARRQRIDRYWHIVGYLAILLLIAKLVLGF